MKKFIALATTTFSFFLLVSFVYADNGPWSLESGNGIDFDCGGTYSHMLDTVVMEENGDFTGTGYYISNDSYTWDISGNITGTDITFALVYTGLGTPYGLNGVGTISIDGSISGTTDGNCQTFSMGAGSALLFQPYGEIIEPTTDEIVWGMTDLIATYEDGDDENDDIVNWAVREGTCDVDDSVNVAGNVGSFKAPDHTPYSWNGAYFSSAVDTTGWTPGMYCFIFNPKDDVGQNDVRETREFYVAESYVNGGGQIIEEDDEVRSKDWLKVSFGGWLANIGGLVGEIQINFHNVGGDTYDKGKFHATDIVALNVVDGNSATCKTAMNFVAHGTYNGEEGYSVVVRAGDSDGPASKDPDDTLRVQLFDHLIDTPLTPGGVYDTSLSNDFTDESSCVGSARTGLDNGNITIIKN